VNRKLKKTVSPIILTGGVYICGAYNDQPRSISNSLALYCSVLHCPELYCITLHCIELYYIVLYCTALHCPVLYCTVLLCIALHCIASHRIALHFPALSFITLPFHFPSPSPSLHLPFSSLPSDTSTVPGTARQGSQCMAGQMQCTDNIPHRRTAVALSTHYCTAAVQY
jgi:hypothetical protein